MYFQSKFSATLVLKKHSLYYSIQKVKNKLGVDNN